MAALATVAAEIESLPRNGWNDHSQYDYATIDDIFDALRQRFGRNGIVFVPTIKDHSINSVTKNSKVQTSALVTLGMTFTHAEDGSTVEAQWLGESMDTSDKALSKAISMAVKTFLKATFLLSSGDDDPDNETPEATPHEKPSPKNEPPAESGWTTAMENAVKRSDKFADFRDICTERGHDPVEVARNAYDEGVTEKSALVSYAEGLPKVGPIEVATMDSISDLFKALDYGLVSRPNQAGSAFIRSVLQIPAGDNVPAIKRLNESEGQMLVRNLKEEADKQKS